MTILDRGDNSRASTRNEGRTGLSYAAGHQWIIRDSKGSSRIYHGPHQVPSKWAGVVQIDTISGAVLSVRLQTPNIIDSAEASKE